MTETSIVPAREAALSGIQRAQEIWNSKQRTVLAAYLGVGADDPALMPMLAICAAWGLDPFAGHVWLIKQSQKGRDGARVVDRYRPTAGRDGYLAIANRHADFRGVQGDVVREEDRFAVTWETTPDGMVPTISHSYEQGPKQGNDRAVRGNVVGAWSIAWRDGRLPVYYFAPWLEHRRDPEKSAWSYKSAMILKAAHSMVLRLAYSITGLVPYDELAAGIRDNVPAGTEDFDLPDVERPWEDDELPWGQDAKMADDLRLAVRLSHERGDRQWSRSRLAMMLPGDKATLLKRIQESVPDPPEEAEEVDGEVA